MTIHGPFVRDPPLPDGKEDVVLQLNEPNGLATRIDVVHVGTPLGTGWVIRLHDQEQLRHQIQLLGPPHEYHPGLPRSPPRKDDHDPTTIPTLSPGGDLANTPRQPTSATCPICDAHVQDVPHPALAQAWLTNHIIERHPRTTRTPSSDYSHTSFWDQHEVHRLKHVDTSITCQVVDWWYPTHDGSRHNYCPGCGQEIPWQEVLSPDG